MDLTPQAIDRVAIRVVQLLRHTEQQPTPMLMSAGELAHHLHVQRPWIYKHRHLLGGQRIGQGPRAQWRFDPHTALQALQALHTNTHATTTDNERPVAGDDTTGEKA